MAATPAPVHPVRDVAPTLVVPKAPRIPAELASAADHALDDLESKPTQMLPVVHPPHAQPREQERPSQRPGA
jgi:hypothetical protein